MEGMLKSVGQHGFRLTVQQWREVGHELNVCLEEHRITAEQYLAAMTQIKALTTPERAAPAANSQAERSRRTGGSRPASGQSWGR
jgi:hypothetical protein